MVHEAENYRDDDEDDESKIELRTNVRLSVLTEQARQQGNRIIRSEVLVLINKQSLEIADGVNVSKDDLDVDAENRI